MTYLNNVKETLEIAKVLDFNKDPPPFLPCQLNPVGTKGRGKNVNGALCGEQQSQFVLPKSSQRRGIWGKKKKKKRLGEVLV